MDYSLMTESGNNNTEDSFSFTLSLYIPIISGKITEAFIKNLFHNLEIGEVSRVDFVNSTKAGRVKREAFVHFNMWYYTRTSSNLQARILDPQLDAKIVYDDPLFWPLLPTKNPAKEQPEYAKETNMKEYEMMIMRNKIAELEDRIKSLNFTNHARDANINYLLGNHLPTGMHDSWVNLSGEINSQSLSNKRIKCEYRLPHQTAVNAVSPYLSPMVPTLVRTPSTPPLPTNLSPPPIARQIAFSLSPLPSPPPPPLLSPNLHPSPVQAMPTQVHNPSPVPSLSPMAIRRANSSCCGQVSDAWIPDAPPKVSNADAMNSSSDSE